ncbi:MAG: hypothetical protein KC643_33685 [Nitrospira sp.]|nr:hypothetical protein [Nitrospira sp.]
MENSEKNYEQRVRRFAKRLGFTVRKSRAQQYFQKGGEYLLLHNSSNTIVQGERFDSSLEEIENYLLEYACLQEA